MQLSHKKLIIISGAVWFIIGVYLLRLGINFLIAGISSGYPSYQLMQPYMGSVENVAIFLVILALLIGYVKGRFVLGKSAIRGVSRIQTFPNPTSIKNIYSAQYYILLAFMVGLGMSIKFLGLNGDIRGFIDVAIGSALINGAMIYFKLALEEKKDIINN